MSSTKRAYLGRMSPWPLCPRRVYPWKCDPHWRRKRILREAWSRSNAASKFCVKNRFGPLLHSILIFCPWQRLDFDSRLIGLGELPPQRPEKKKADCGGAFGRSEDAGTWTPWKGSRNLGAMSTDWPPRSADESAASRHLMPREPGFLVVCSRRQWVKHIDFGLVQCLHRWMPECFANTYTRKGGRWPPNKRQPFATVCSQAPALVAWKPKPAAHSKVCWTGEMSVSELGGGQPGSCGEWLVWLHGWSRSSMDGKLRQSQRPPRPK